MFGLFKKKVPKSNAERGKGSSKPELKNRKLKLNTSELRIGMYVMELDRPWLETPFKVQGFRLRDRNDIAEVKKHCNYVYIDVHESSRLGVSELNQHDLKKKSHRLPDKEHWFSEQAVYQRANKLTFELLDNIALGGPGISKSAKKVVASCIESVLKNPYTMVLVAQMAKRGKALEDHAMSCCVLSAAFGKYLGLDDKDLKKLALGGLLHDVGMLKISSPGIGKLTEEEKKAYREHVIIGRNILMANEDFWPAVDVAYSHHERIDGRGYPRGLVGERIPYFARIVSIVETYDNLVSNHTYKETVVSPTEAMAELYRNRGKQFDRALVESFIRYMGLYPLGSLVQLVSGDIGIVVEKNPFYKRMPKVVLIRDSKGNEIRSGIIDLFHEKSGTNASKYMIKKTLPNGSFGIYTENYLEEGIIEVGKEEAQALI
ncbi:MAG: HD domain-containing phosphohydrolase [Sedimenticola sp.]